MQWSLRIREIVLLPIIVVTKVPRDLHLLIVKEHSHTYLSRTTVMQARVQSLQMILENDNTSDYKIQTGEQSISICNV